MCLLIDTSYSLIENLGLSSRALQDGISDVSEEQISSAGLHIKEFGIPLPEHLPHFLGNEARGQFNQLIEEEERFAPAATDQSQEKCR